VSSETSTIVEISNMTNLQQASQTVKKGRLHWIDYAKGIGIFLVVVGHVLQGLVNSSLLEKSPIIDFIYQWIYAFHMPLFFVISGLFVQRSLSKSFQHFLLNKLYVIAYPYFVWSFIQISIQWLTSRYTNQPSSPLDILKIIYQPHQQFWFLYTLFIILVTYGLFHKLKSSPTFFLIFSALLYVLYCLDINIGPWGVLYLVRRHAIYFALGVILASSNLLTKFSKLPFPMLIVITLVGYLTVGVGVKLQFTENAIAIPWIAILGTTASLALSVLLEKSNLFGVVKAWGLFSLEIFVVHIIAASSFRVFLQKFIGITEPTIHFILGTAIGIYIPILLSMICLRLGFQSMFKIQPLKA
jgi:fucose 4-O-acetylase-like acetyltransferase